MPLWDGSFDGSGSSGMPRPPASNVALGSAIMLLSAVCVRPPPRARLPSPWPRAAACARTAQLATTDNASLARRVASMPVVRLYAGGLIVQRAAMTTHVVPAPGCRSAFARKHSSWAWLLGLLIYGCAPAPHPRPLPKHPTARRKTLGVGCNGMIRERAQHLRACCAQPSISADTRQQGWGSQRFMTFCQRSAGSAWARWR